VPDTQVRPWYPAVRRVREPYTRCEVTAHSWPHPTGGTPRQSVRTYITYALYVTRAWASSVDGERHSSTLDATLSDNSNRSMHAEGGSRDRREAVPTMIQNPALRV